MTGTLLIVRGGALTTVQDKGRRGLAHLAVPRSGALDVASYRLANRLVGNPDDAAVLETTLTGVAFRPDRRCRVAVTGALARIRADGRDVAWSAPVLVEAGQVVDVGMARRGVRSYVAVSGGIAVEPVFGSRSTDLLSGIGPPVVRDGAVLPLGPAVSPAGPFERSATGQAAPGDPASHASLEDEITLGCYLGPRDDWLTDQAIATLRSAVWTVSMNSNRVALRLTGPALEQRDTAELSSEGVVLGAVEVPPDGQPIIFLADHPSTGGYPVAGVVPEPDIWLCGQARPGTRVRFEVRRAGLATAPTGRG